MKDLWKLLMTNVGVIFGDFEKPGINIIIFFEKSVRFLIYDGKPKGNHGYPKASPVSFLMYQ